MLASPIVCLFLRAAGWDGVVTDRATRRHYWRATGLGFVFLDLLAACLRPQRAARAARHEVDGGHTPATTFVPAERTNVVIMRLHRHFEAVFCQ